ncbi:lipase class 3 family protein [Tricholoma matsutake]|nr:lipase class 3 family protein [Tricholoma matsutake 945]
MFSTTFLRFASLLGLLASTVVQAAPTFEARQSITTLSSAQIASFKPFTYFASTGYCSPSTTLTWTCGANCNANPDFIPVASGGDGSTVQFWYVGFWPSQNTVIVTHQGTNPTQIAAIATDVNAFLENLDSSLFPGISSVQVHNGFANEQKKTATQVLAAVNQALSAHGANHVTIVGHSLGAAIGLLDAVYLPLHIPGVTFRMIGYGMPRVGNPEFASYIDAHLDLTHINNKEDPVPILPGRFMGYAHPSGEVHIEDSGAWVACPGDDNTDKQCTVGDVPNIFASDVMDHDGPYDGVTMGIC